MAQRKFIDTWLREARKAHAESTQTHVSTFDAVAHVAANQVIRNMIRDGWINEEASLSRKTAKRVDPDLPQCPPGFIYDRDRKDCVPKTARDGVKGNSNNKNELSGSSYNIWGSHGQNGAPHAYEEPFVRGSGGFGDGDLGDGVGAMGESVSKQIARVKKKAKVKAACNLCGYAKCRCDNPLIRPFTL